MDWTGRFDGNGSEHARWHQRVRQVAQLPGSHEHVSLVGFASDEGVRRNAGRVGAAEGPAAIRGALGSLPLHRGLATGEVAIADHGDVTVDGEDLEIGQDAMGRTTAEALGAPGNRLTLVLGGGHETAWASYLGLTRSGIVDGRRWGVLNLDAHFDLRDADHPSSGTPFLQMAEAELAEGRAFHYGVIGISEHSNTGVLFERADELNVDYLLDHACTPERVTTFVNNFAAGIDVLYLTVDLDVLPGSVAPGVSAPAAMGVPPCTILHAVRAAARTGKLRLMDVVELNPSLDVDHRTARTAARLISEAAHLSTGQSRH